MAISVFCLSFFKNDRFRRAKNSGNFFLWETVVLYMYFYYVHCSPWLRKGRWRRKSVWTAGGKRRLVYVVPNPLLPPSSKMGMGWVNTMRRFLLPNLGRRKSAANVSIPPPRPFLGTVLPYVPTPKRSTPWSVRVSLSGIRKKTECKVFPVF